MSKDVFSGIIGTGEVLNESLDRVFKTLVSLIAVTTAYDPLYQVTSITAGILRKEGQEREEAFSDLGVERTWKGEALSLRFDAQQEFLNELLVREALRLFYPKEIHDHPRVTVANNVMVGFLCSNLPNVEKWRMDVVYKQFTISELNFTLEVLENFLNSKPPEGVKHPMHYIFRQLRLKRIDQEGMVEYDSFVDRAFFEYMEATPSKHWDPKLLETTHALSQIFYDKKMFTNDSDYRKAFRTLETPLMLKDFTHFLKEIKEQNVLSPSYRPNWKKLGVSVIHVDGIFNPCLANEVVDRLIEHVPFGQASRRSSAGLGNRFLSWIIVPTSLENSARHFLDRLEEENVVHFTFIGKFNRFSNHVNLRFFLEENELFTTKDIGSLGDRIIRFNEPEHNVVTRQVPLTCLDFLLINQSRNFAQSGLGFRKTSELADNLKKTFFEPFKNAQFKIQASLRMILKHRVLGLNQDYLAKLQERVSVDDTFSQALQEDIKTMLDYKHLAESKDDKKEVRALTKKYKDQREHVVEILQTLNENEDTSDETLPEELIAILLKTFESAIKAQESLLQGVDNLLEKINQLRNFQGFLEKHKSKGFIYSKNLVKDVLTLSNEFKRLLSVKGERVFTSLSDELDLAELFSGILISSSSFFALNNEEALHRAARLFMKHSSNPARLDAVISQYQYIFRVLDTFKQLNVPSLYRIDVYLFKNPRSLDKILVRRKALKEDILDTTITSKTLKQKLHQFALSEEPLVFPMMIGTIQTSSNLSLDITTLNTEESKQYFKDLIRHVPRVQFVQPDQNVFRAQVLTRALRTKDKLSLMSIIANNIGSALLSFEAAVNTGRIKTSALEDYYDFKEGTFLNSVDDMSEYLHYLGQLVTSPKSFELGATEITPWITEERELERLAERISNRRVKAPALPSIELLKQLSRFYFNPSFPEIPKQVLPYVSSIRLAPAWKRLGLSKYHLYLRPVKPKEFDYEHLLSNTFTDLKQELYLGPSKSVFISYLYPNNSPHLKSLKTQAGGKKNVLDYCLFKEIRTHSWFTIAGFTSKGWLMEENVLDALIKRVLFSKRELDGGKLVKVFDLDTNEMSQDHADPQDPHRTAVFSYFHEGSIDLKRFSSLATESHAKTIKTLKENKLIALNVKLKHLRLPQKVQILIPDVKEEDMNRLLEIFKFFNYGEATEISGKIFIKNCVDEEFEHGLFVRLRLPDINFARFRNLLIGAFNFLGITHFTFFELLDAKPLLKHLHGSLDFLDRYRPHENLRWDEAHRLYRADDTYDEEGKAVYPSLVKEEKEEK